MCALECSEENVLVEDDRYFLKLHFPQSCSGLGSHHGIMSISDGIHFECLLSPSKFVKCFEERLHAAESGINEFLSDNQVRCDIGLSWQ